MRLFISIIIWSFSVFVTLAECLVTLFFTVILFPFDKDRRVVHAQGFWWADAIINFNPYWDLKVTGLDNIDKKKTYVIVANHQSLADIVILYKTHMQFKWVSKEEVFRIPLIGWCLAFGKHIKLARGDIGSVKKVYREAARWLRRDISVIFFPEGTRSKTDKMNKFQNGAFKLAIKEKRAVLPIAIKGTRDTIPKGSWVFKSKAIARAMVLPAIETKDLSQGDFKALRDMTYNRLEDALGKADNGRERLL